MQTKSVLIFLIVLIVAVTMTGCTGNSPKPVDMSEDTGKKEVEKNNDSTANPVPKEGKEKKIGGGGKLTMFYTAPESLDWRYGGWAVIYARQLYSEGLTRLNENYKAIPGMAKEWSTDDEGKTWTFLINEDAKWSNGDKFTAFDIVRSWQHTIDPAVWSQKNNTPWYTTGESEIVNQKDIMAGKTKPTELGVEAKDDHTLIVHLVNPIMDFPERAAMNWGLALHSNVMEDPDHAFKVENIVVNGPYKPKEFTINEKTVWIPNEHYYDNVTLDEITLKMADNAAQTNLPAYMNNEVQIMQVTAAELAAIEKDPTLSKELASNTSAGFKVLTYLNNSPNSVLEDPRIGLALNMAIDKELLAKTVSRGTVEPINSLIPSFIDPNWPNQLTYDVEKAQQLLADAGFPDGKGLPTIQISVAHGASVDPFILGVKEQWETNLGIKVQVDNIGDWGAWWTKINNPLEENYVGFYDDAYTPAYASAIPLLTQGMDYFKKSFSGKKYKEFVSIRDNKELDNATRLQRLDEFFLTNATDNGRKYKELVDQILTSDSATKQKLAKEADQLRLESGLYIPLYAWKSFFLVKSNVKGYIADKLFLGKPLYFNGITTN